MAKLFGALNINDSERIFVQGSQYQDIVYAETMRLFARYNAEANLVMDLFVERTTEDYKRRYKLPGIGGTLQMEGRYAPSAAVKAGGAWDVAFPLYQYGDQIAWSEIDIAYMSMEDYDLHLQTVFADDSGTLRILMLNALFGGTATTFVDPHAGSLTIQPLANQDGTLYLPPVGSTAPAEQNAYLVSGYAASTISDTNNPVLTMVNWLESLWGAATGGSDIRVFINPAQTAKIQALTDFVEVFDRRIVPGDTTTTIGAMPPIPPGMRLLGRLSGAWVYEWRRMPSGYMIGLHPDEPKPLVKRVDPANTGLPDGLIRAAEDENYPFKSWFYRRRLGFGVGNRLGAVAMFLDAGSTWTAPTITA